MNEMAKRIGESGDEKLGEKPRWRLFI